MLTLAIIWGLFALMVGAILTAGVSPAAVPDPRDEALRICAVFKEAGIADVCEYRGTNVRVHMRATRSEAAKICAETTAVMAPHTRSLANSWQLHIVSEGDDERTLAVCTFK